MENIALNNLPEACKLMSSDKRVLCYYMQTAYNNTATMNVLLKGEKLCQKVFLKFYHRNY